MKKLLALLIVLSSAITGYAQQSTPPNIVFLFSDDQNVDSVGVYGNPEVQTPNMDALASNGIVFDRHYNTTAICMASRANVMTGMYEYKHGTNFDHGNMTAEIWSKSYPVLLRESGYYTAFAGKFGFEIDGFGFDASSFFDKWGGGSGQTSYNTGSNQNNISEYANEYPHSTLAYGAFGQDAIREAVAANKPFCLSLSFKAPHRPESPDPQFDDIYQDYMDGTKSFTRAPNYGREFSSHMSPQSKAGRQWTRWDNWGNGPQYATEYDLVMASYYQQIYAIDVAIGMVRETLAEEGVDDNTIVIFTSDNGFMCGAHGYGSKVLPMEESSRAPLIIYDPRTPGGGQRCSALTGNIDFAPYMLEEAGVAVPENVDGFSLSALMQDPNQSIREQMAFINVWGPMATQCLTVLTQDKKYTYWWFSDNTMDPFHEMYDLSADPYEFINLAADPANNALLAEMQARYDAELELWQQNAVPFNNYQVYGTLFEIDETVVDDGVTTSIVEFQDNLIGAAPLGLADQAEDFAVALTNMVMGDQSGTDLVFDDVSITTNGGTFTFDVTVTPGNGVGEISAVDGEFNSSLAEIDAGTTTSSLFEGGDTITVSVSDVQGATFDGFVNFGSDNSGVGEGINVNGIDYIRGTATNGDSDPRQGIALPVPGILAQNSVDIEFIGDSVSLRGFALQFTQTSNSFLLGDVNRDGVVNFLDIAPFIALLAAEDFQIEADSNKDLEVDFLDIAPFIQLLSGD